MLNISVFESQSAYPFPSPFLSVCPSINSNPDQSISLLNFPYLSLRLILQLRPSFELAINSLLYLHTYRLAHLLLPLRPSLPLLSPVPSTFLYSCYLFLFFSWEKFPSLKTSPNQQPVTRKALASIYNPPNFNGVLVTSTRNGLNLGSNPLWRAGKDFQYRLQHIFLCTGRPGICSKRQD